MSKTSKSFEFSVHRAISPVGLLLFWSVAVIAWICWLGYKGDFAGICRIIFATSVTSSLRSLFDLGKEKGLVKIDLSSGKMPLAIFTVCATTLVYVVTGYFVTTENSRAFTIMMCVMFLLMGLDMAYTMYKTSLNGKTPKVAGKISKGA